MGTENFQYDVNIEGVMKQDADSSIKEGILLQTIQQSKKGPVVLVIDELDKARPEVDSFLLDFLENGRLTTGTDTYEKGQYPIYTFITSNDKREIDEALLNRSKRVEVPRPNKELFLEILGLPENHYLGYIYNKCPNFSIRQARQYIEDLEVLGTQIDEEALSQYINLDELDVMSVADLQHIAEMENGDLEFELPDLDRCYITLNSNNQQGWMKLFEDGNKGQFRLYSDENETGDLYVYIEEDYIIEDDVNSTINSRETSRVLNSEAGKRLFDLGYYKISKEENVVRFYKYKDIHGTYGISKIDIGANNYHNDSLKEIDDGWCFFEKK